MFDERASASEEFALSRFVRLLNRRNSFRATIFSPLFSKKSGKEKLNVPIKDVLQKMKDPLFAINIFCRVFYSSMR